MAVLVCHVGWMNLYEGQVQQPDQIVGGGKWVDKHKDGGETCNFLKCRDGYTYGHVETIKKTKDRPISIELLNAAKGAPYVDHVDVIWTATDPHKRGRWVVGWYRDARVYRERQRFKKFPSPQHEKESGKDYRIKVRNSFAIPAKQRKLKLGRGKGWIGQANWWFPENSKKPAVKRFIQKARGLMDAGLEPIETPVPTRLPTKGRGHWGGKSDPKRNAEVERAAILAVENHYFSYKVKSVERENLGWDLEVEKNGDSALRLEVKGLFGADLQIGLTPREYRAFRQHIDGAMPSYRLCVVTSALSGRPRLVIFKYSSTEKRWIDEKSGKNVTPKIALLEAAIISLS